MRLKYPKDWPPSIRKEVAKYFTKRRERPIRFAGLSEFGGKRYSKKYPHEEAEGTYVVCRYCLEINSVTWHKGKIMQKICCCLARFRQSQYFQPVYKLKKTDGEELYLHRVWIDPYELGDGV